MTAVSAISQRIWDMKYRFRAPGPAGEVFDKTIEDSWARIARALAEPENDPAMWCERFTRALGDFRFLPAGRIVAGAGTARDVTLFNCFVMGAVPDDMSGIFEHLREAALTLQQGGGIGYDFSTLRPKGALVRGVGADASGPLSFMDVWDAMCRTIMSAGSRRGAMMATLRCDHPDIEAFIDAKQEPGRLRMFNLSVLITDDFMRAAKQDDAWELVFGGQTYRTVKARELWDRIMRATYAYAEPGVIFIDRVNALNNLNYCETIAATNPCVTGESWVHTTEGPRQVHDLVGRPFAALVDGRPRQSGAAGFFSTSHKDVLLLTTVEGHALRLTADHPVRRAASVTRDRIAREWVKAGNLQPGDRIVLNDHRAGPSWGGPGTEEEGYLTGLLIGDGTLKTDKAVLSVWPRAAAVGDKNGPDGVRAVMAQAERAARTLPHRADFTGWVTVAGRGEYRLSLAALSRLADELGLRPGSKSVTPAIERSSSDFCRGFLRGFFDADGSVQGDQKKGVSVRLAQSDLDRLRAVQRMLLRLGINSTIHAERRPAGASRLPDGRGGSKWYATRPQHELIIARDNLLRFADMIGFGDTDKATRLSTLIAGYRRLPNRERFIARVSAVDPVGAEEVFDVEVPGVNAFDANGLYVHNCGEQPLPPYGACLLGSINLARLVNEPFTDQAALDMEALGELVPVAVRMMDNVIDVSRFPLPAQAEEARAKRRIGLGVTGLADALILCGVRYGSERAVALCEQWMGTIERHAYLASTALAAEKGAFPMFDADAYLAGAHILGLDEDVREAIAAHGIRNALLTSIAPTGTISLFADNVTSGIEPVFAFTYKRNVLMPDGTRQTEEVSDYAWRLHRRTFGEDAELPDYFIDAQSLSPRDHLVMQAAAQKYIDSSISKTINCPEALPFEAFKDIYAKAYEMGCKGCTTYRPNPVTGAVLEASSAADAPEDAPQPELPLDAPPHPTDGFESGGVVYMTQPLDRPEELPGQTYKIKWADSDHAIYITINDIIQDGRRRPFEIFINSKNMEHFAWTVALTRMISAVFRRGGDVSFVVEELKAVFDPRGGHWFEGKYVPSLLAAIGQVIERHMITIGFLPVTGAGERPQPVAAVAGGGDAGGASPDSRRIPNQCPKCGEAALIRQEGCDLCTTCGYSKCG
ncbi:MAG: LAGLIDADG family homing endonuclease [Alphaproteobacteria bacterium]